MSERMEIVGTYVLLTVGCSLSAWGLSALLHEAWEPTKLIAYCALYQGCAAYARARRAYP